MMKELMMNEDFSDITLVTEDKEQIKANINILSACSPVFKDILKKDNNSSPIMYLRGIQYSEMESIMQFIYLGEATFCEERTDEFLAVAKSLEIKMLCNAEAETNNDPEEEPLPSHPDPSTNKETEHIFDDIIEQSPQNKGDVVSENRMFECDLCLKTYPSRSGLNHHRHLVHEGVKYDCDQCDHQFNYNGDLTRHIQSKHEIGIKYACDQCDYQATTQRNFTAHIKSKHKGVKYACDQCDYQATQRPHLTRHIQSIHKGVKYVCDQCDYQAMRKDCLASHIQSKH